MNYSGRDDEPPPLPPRKNRNTSTPIHLIQHSKESSDTSPSDSDFCNNLYKSQSLIKDTMDNNLEGFSNINFNINDKHSPLSAVSSPYPAFQRTHSLCYRKKKKNEVEAKSLTVPRRKLILSNDDYSFDYYSNNGHQSLDTNLSPANSFIREEHVEDLTEKIITNINDHLERFEKNQHGEVERDNKILNRENAILKEKIRMLEDLMRENDAKADNKISDLISTNRKYFCELEKEKTEEIQRLKFQIHELERQVQDQGCIQERLQNTVDNLKQQNQELTREITVCNETNRDLRDSKQTYEDKYMRLNKRFENQNITKDILRHDTLSNLSSIKQELIKFLDSSGDSASDFNDHKINNHNDSSDDSNKNSPDALIFEIIQLIHRIKKDKDKINFEKAKIMNNLIGGSNVAPETPFNSTFMDEPFEYKNTDSNHDSSYMLTIGDELMNHFNSNITPEQQSFLSSTVDVNETSKVSGENPFPQEDDLFTKGLQKENIRLKRYIDRLLLIILETQPSLLEIKESSKFSPLENGED